MKPPFDIKRHNGFVREKGYEPGEMAFLTSRYSYSLPAGLKPGDQVKVIEKDLPDQRAVIEDATGRRHEIQWFLCVGGMEAEVSLGVWVEYEHDFADERTAYEWAHAATTGDACGQIRLVNNL